MSLTPMTGDTGGLKKIKTSLREKNPVDPVPACKNLMSQVKI
jgi:hypothetical protein